MHPLHGLATAQTHGAGAARPGLLDSPPPRGPSAHGNHRERKIAPITSEHMDQAFAAGARKRQPQRSPALMIAGPLTAFIGRAVLRCSARSAPETACARKRETMPRAPKRDVRPEARCHERQVNAMPMASTTRLRLRIIAGPIAEPAHSPRDGWGNFFWGGGGGGDAPHQLRDGKRKADGW